MTLRALSLAAAGGQALLRRLDLHAANLAQAETAGYKRIFMNHDQSPALLMDAGRIRKTHRDLDVAIDGEGYFRVLLQDGTSGFTRAGNFSRDAQGTLTGPDGLPLDPPIFVPSTVTRLIINPLGHVQGFDPARPASLIPLGHLSLSRFGNPAALQALSGTLFRETPESGDRIDGRPGEVGGFLRQGQLELSNVDPLRELTELNQLRRAYELNARAFQVVDQALQSVNHLRRKA
jgi:flagellar basal-body rod protein FlgG